MRFVNLLLPTILMVTTSSLEAQEVIHSWPVSPACSLVRGSLPDVDGDGFRDVLAGSDALDPGGLQDAGGVCLLSGRTGTELFHAYGSRPNFNLGSKIAPLGDTNGDGVPDYAATAFRGGTTFVYSGEDGKVLLEHPRWSAHMADLGDLDQDGYADFLFITGLTGTLVRAWVYRGGSYEVKFTIEVPSNPAPGFPLELGESALLGDVNSDGVGDLVIGAFHPTTKRLIPGRVFAYSGATDLTP